MSVKSCEKIEKSQVVLTIEVGAPEFEAAIEKAYQKMRKKINVPGFRPGKSFVDEYTAHNLIYLLPALI